MLTQYEFDKLPEGIIRTGICSNSPHGAFMTNEGGVLKFVAVKWSADEWGLYIERTHHSDEYIKNSGNFICNMSIVRNLVPCEQSLMAMYKNP